MSNRPTLFWSQASLRGEFCPLMFSTPANTRLTRINSNGNEHGLSESRGYEEVDNEDVKNIHYLKREYNGRNSWSLPSFTECYRKKISYISRRNFMLTNDKNSLSVKEVENLEFSCSITVRHNESFPSSEHTK
ncbi:unnamed protein product [Rhizophagus irregularis]|nr:unnamed protein product [Rhizophagus irregularis]